VFYIFLSALMIDVNISRKCTSQTISMNSVYGTMLNLVKLKYCPIMNWIDTSSNSRTWNKYLSTYLLDKFPSPSLSYSLHENVIYLMIRSCKSSKAVVLNDWLEIDWAVIYLLDRSFLIGFIIFYTCWIGELSNYNCFSLALEIIYLLSEISTLFVGFTDIGLSEPKKYLRKWKYCIWVIVPCFAWSIWSKNCVKVSAQSLIWNYGI